MIQATWINNKKKPLDDPRVRRAMHLVLDRPVLVDVVKDVAPMMVGGFIYPFSEFATPKEELRKRLGYQADPAAAIKEATRADGGGRPRRTASRGWTSWSATIATFKLWSQAIQAMLTAGAQHRVQTAHGGRVGVVRRRRERQFRSGDRRHRVDAARSRRTTSMPGTARTARRTIRSGTTRSSRP